MNALVKRIATGFRGVASGWKNFWFTPSLPDTLALIRHLRRSHAALHHVVWSINLDSFLGGMRGSIHKRLHSSAKLRTAITTLELFVLIDSPALLWMAHIARAVVFAMLTVGFCTRVVAVLAVGD